MAVGVIAQQTARGGAASITPEALRVWLAYIASDDLQGRSTDATGGHGVSLVAIRAVQKTFKSTTSVVFEAASEIRKASLRVSLRRHERVSDYMQQVK